MTFAIGLMSGTSADGISAALGSFQGRQFKFLGLVHHPYPADVFQKIRQGGQLKTAELSALHVQLGDLFAEATLKLLKKTHTSPKDVVCIGSHGQTIYHGPDDSIRNTFQIADPAVIAERTGISVVSNFRQRDIAAGGQGAPLIPYFDHYFYGDGPVRAFQNIGGIANVTVVGKGVSTPLAFDTGPGNSLMDMAVHEITGGKESFDHHGQCAKQGTIDTLVAAQLMEHPYFKLPPPKSTGPELFGRALLTQYFGKILHTKPNDVLATLNYFTCLSIQESYRNHIFGKYPIEEIVVSGGGVHNKTMMKKLECLFAPIPVVAIDYFHPAHGPSGLPSQAKEPLAFAFFGLRCFQHKTNHLPSGTGAKHERILGSVTYA